MYDTEKVQLISPKDIIQNGLILKNGLCYIYIENLLIFSRVCQFLRMNNCHLVFFFKFEPNEATNNRFPVPIYSSKMAVFDFVSNFLSPKATPLLRTKVLSKIRMKHVLSASYGLDNYERWVLRRSQSLNPQVIRNHYRTLLASVGLYKICAYNRLLAERISLAYAITIGSISGFNSILCEKMVNSTNKFY